MLRSAFLYSAEILAGAMLVLALLRVRVPRSLLWGVVGYGIFAYAVLTVLDWPKTDDLGATDLFQFWSAGRDFWQGGDPYASPAILNPPTAAPLYALFGMTSLPTAAAIWYWLNSLGGLLLVPLAYRTLSTGGARTTGNCLPSWLACLRSSSVSPLPAVTARKWASSPA